MSNYRFRFHCAYLGCTDYEVFSREGGLRRVLSVRHTVTDYEANIYNGNPDEIRAEIGLLRWHCSASETVPAEICDAFNTWRAQEHSQAIAKMKSEPERYGDILDSDYPAPQSVVPGTWSRETGWRAA